MNLDLSFWNSVRQLRNPLIFVPDAVLIVITLILGTALFRFSGLSQVMESLAVSEGFQVELFQGLLAERWVTLVIGALFFFVTTFMLGVGADVLRFNLIKDVISKKKPSLGNAWKAGRSLYWDVVVLKVLVYLLSLAVLFAITALGGLLFLVFGDLNSVGFLVSLGFVGFVLLVLLRVFLLFRYPIMFLDKGGHPGGIIRGSFLFARANFSYAVLVILLLAVALVVFGIVTWPVSVLLDYVQGLLAAGLFASLFGYFARLVTSLVQLLYVLWMHLFVFNAYLSRRRGD